MIDQKAFREMWPLPMRVEALTPWKSLEDGLRKGCVTWEYLSDFPTVTRYGTLTARRGERTDFASIPNAALWFLDDDSPLILWAAGGHDTGWQHRKTDEGRILTLREVNDVLIDGMKVLGAPWHKRAIVRKAVDIYGWSTNWEKQAA